MGIKAVNALSDFFEIQAYRDGETRSYQFCRGKEIPKGRKDGATEEPNGTRTAFHADPDIFPAATQFRPEYIEKMCRYYSYLNKGLALHFNGRRYISKNGLLDLLAEAMSEEPCTPSSIWKGMTLKWPSPTAANTGRSTTPSSTGSTPPRRHPPGGLPGSHRQNPEGLLQEKL